MKKIILLILFVVVALGAIFIFITRDYWWQKYLITKYLREFNSLEETYRLDTNGGETPEETLELLIKALEAKDAKLASSYFIPEKRKEMVGEFKEGFRSGGVDYLINDLKKEKEKTCQDNFICVFETFENGNSEFSFEFIKNNNKWLIKSL